MNFPKQPKSLLAVAILAAYGVSPAAVAQDNAPDGADLEEIIVTGARGRPRTATDSPVPVDVFTADDIEAISHTDTNNILQTLVPSYNVSRQPISDGATFVRPAQLRGLPTDKTLMLVNNKRRHRSALVTLLGGDGAQAPDAAIIPAVAIKNVEVLRDGASAQYGSDAIAGVINFLLKDDTEGGTLTVDTGQYFEGDGALLTVQGNIGLPLGADGFINISGELNQTDFSNRADQYCESWWCVPNAPGFADWAAANPAAAARANDPRYLNNYRNANFVGVTETVQPWGQPTTDVIRLFVNTGYQIDADTEFYAYANYSDGEVDNNFYHRYPGNGVIEELRRPDGTIYTPQDRFPGGFVPQFGATVLDFSFVGGLRGELDNGLTYDVSGRTGENEMQYLFVNTINPSLGDANPTMWNPSTRSVDSYQSIDPSDITTRFRPSDLINRETQFQADLTYEFDAGLAGPLTFAFGGSYLSETYTLTQGNLESYVDGPFSQADPWNLCTNEATVADRTPTAAGMAAAAAIMAAGDTALNCANANDPVYTVVPVGSNGFPGNSPQFIGEYDRQSAALYAELSGDVTDRLFLQGAVRFEDYQDFSSEILYQLAGRLIVTGNTNLRASIGTGFRAPTPGQQGTINVSTVLPDGFPVARGIFPPGGPVAAALGATGLGPETSQNITFGIATSLGALDLTVDYYRIDIDDRTQLISERQVLATLPATPTDAQRQAFANFQALDAAGVAGANTIGLVQFFANAYDSRTEGFDIVANYPIDWGNSQTRLIAAVNFNENSFRSDPRDPVSFLNAETEYDFVNFNPQWRGVFTGIHEVNDFRVVGRLSWFGESTNSNSGGTVTADNPDGLRFQELSAFYQFDLEGQWQINDLLNLAVGARNVTDAYPDRDTIDDPCCGLPWDESIVAPWQGGYYYARLRADF